MKLFIRTVLYSVVLGICIDLVTANIAVDYFAVYHPRVVDSRSPWVMAIIWGVGASWWAGAICGGVLALYHRRKAPTVSTDLVLRWVRNSCAVIWAAMMSIVAIAYAFTSRVAMSDRGSDFEYKRRLIVVAVAHQFEYVFGAIALIVVLVLLRREARRTTVNHNDDDNMV